MGLGRSGSTLLSQILAQNDRFEAVGELRALWTKNFSPDQLCSCGEQFQHCAFWSDVLKRCADYGITPTDYDRIDTVRHSVERFRHLSMLLGTHSTREFRETAGLYRQFASRMYRSILEVSGADVVVDSSKRFPTALLLRQCPDLDIRFIHLVRDSRGVAYSWRKKVLRHDAGSGRASMRSRPCIRTARQWLFANWLVERTIVRSGKCLRVLYRDLIEAPEQTMKEIFEFGWNQSLPGGLIQKRSVSLERPAHICLGNPKRMRAGKVELRMDEEWKRELPLLQKLIVTGITAPLLMKYGFSLSGR